MKKIIVFLFTIFAISRPSLSQNYYPFPASNATWCDERYDAAWPVPNYYYNYYKTNGEILVNDTLYTLFSDNENLDRCYLREENKRVYCRLGGETPEFMIYDFGLDLGDTFRLPEFCGEFFHEGVADQVDSILIGDNFHRTTHIDCPEWHSVTFIEGVGSDLGLMYCDLPWVDIWGDLYCFSLNDTIYETNGSGNFVPGNCWIYIGTPENQSGHLVIYPNPASNVIQVDFHDECRLEMHSLTGVIVRESSCKSMAINDLHRGLYILEIYSLNGTLLQRTKITKM